MAKIGLCPFGDEVLSFGIKKVLMSDTLTFNFSILKDSEKRESGGWLVTLDISSVLKISLGLLLRKSLFPFVVFKVDDPEKSFSGSLVFSVVMNSEYGGVSNIGVVLEIEVFAGKILTFYTPIFGLKIIFIE